MGRIIYDSKRIIPAPLVNITKNYQVAGDGEKLGSLFTLSVRGKLVAHKGSPDSTGTFYTGGSYPSDETISSSSRLAAIMRKQEALRDLFADEGRTFEIQSADGSAPIKCNPRVISIDFAEGIWHDLCDYTITLEADVLYVNGTQIGEDAFSTYISSASESWSFETNEDQFLALDQKVGIPTDFEANRTYRLTHNINATGKRFYDNTGTLLQPAWKNAKDWVLPRLGFDVTIAQSSGVNNIPSYYSGFNHIRNEQTDEIGGNYSVTETWLLSSGSAIESFEVQTNTSSDGRTAVVINGTINGLELKDSNFNVLSTKYQNADSKWSGVLPSLLTRAQTYSGKTLNITPVVLSVGKNPAIGVINYNYEYDNRPSNLITGTIAESINISDNYDVDAFAAIGVLGRTAGPVLQSLNSHKENSRTLNVELVFDNSYFPSGTAAQRFRDNHPRFKTPQSTQITDIIDAVHPISAGLINNAGNAASVAYIADKNDSWDGAGRYSLNIQWIWE